LDHARSARSHRVVSSLICASTCASAFEKDGDAWVDDVLVEPLEVSAGPLEVSAGPLDDVVPEDEPQPASTAHARRIDVVCFMRYAQ
jgi:hypothetical protein